MVYADCLVVSNNRQGQWINQDQTEQEKSRNPFRRHRILKIRKAVYDGGRGGLRLFLPAFGYRLPLRDTGFTYQGS